MLLGAFCVIALLVTGVLGCIGRSPLDAFAARSAKPVPLTPMEQAQKDLDGVTVTYQFGDQIRKVIAETLEGLGITRAEVHATDKGALDCTIRARVTAAAVRAKGKDVWKD